MFIVRGHEARQHNIKGRHQDWAQRAMKTSWTDTKMNETLPWSLHRGFELESQWLYSRSKEMTKLQGLHRFSEMFVNFVVLSTPAYRLLNVHCSLVNNIRDGHERTSSTSGACAFVSQQWFWTVSSAMMHLFLHQDNIWWYLLFRLNYSQDNNACLSTW